MTNTEKLTEAIKSSGYKRSYIAGYVGLSLTGLTKKVNNESDFRASEIQKLCELLKISPPEKEKIFFAADVDKISPKGKEA